MGVFVDNMRNLTMKFLDSVEDGKQGQHSNVCKFSPVAVDLIQEHLKKQLKCL